MATQSGGTETAKRTGGGSGSASGSATATAPESGTATRSARVPKYYRLKRHLLEMTETMPPGTPVPPERTLATEFDTSRTTVRQALQELVVEGRLERIQGKGTFVAKPKVSQALQLTSYTEDMRAQGLEPTSQLLDIGYVTADDTLAVLLDIQPGGRVLRIERLRLASGEPMAIETTHLSAKRFPALRRSLAKYTSLYTALAEVYDVRLAEAEETIETSLATPREAGLLGTDVGLPMLMLSRHSYDEQGAPVEWVRSVYRGDRYKFVARLKRPADD
ncbi:GntR family transcriptional regulator [Streptomyces sp. MUM 203J]|uniref:GntR family transcriptional regulator n=1 Tax=Streptomyces sp. MUM 203J TaxID=2791990 RepID=UPI001F03C072|nr:GntR family transcriptional regulator [Streptomyces sp. MUM 203J]MCH0538288.1 GntR family transcriptional regulator [Streptomyces sp. MUM 203J]